VTAVHFEPPGDRTRSYRSTCHARGRTSCLPLVSGKLPARPNETCANDSLNKRSTPLRPRARRGAIGMPERCRHHPRCAARRPRMRRKAPAICWSWRRCQRLPLSGFG